MGDQKWHSLDASGVLESLKTQAKGLSTEEAKSRLVEFGPNELTGEKSVSVWSLIAGQFKSALIIILLAAVAVSLAVGIITYQPGHGLPEEITDAIVILAIVLACVTLGVVEEFRSEKAMAALKKMAAPTATVVRNGADIEIPARELVPGDIVVLSSGDRVPADLRLFEVYNLRTEEASLTGESTPVEKVVKSIPGADAALGDRKNMAYSGTTVAYGRAKGVVTETGMKTEFGKIATMLQSVEDEETPLEKNLDKVGKWLGYACLAVVGIVVTLVLVRTYISTGTVTGHTVLEIFIWGVSLAVAAVPEALPAVVVISLAIGVQKMVKKHALIRRLAAVETLGSTTVICSDKTGTLTQDEMTIRRVYAGGKLISVTGVGYDPKGDFLLDNKKFDTNSSAPFKELIRIGALCNDTHLVQVDGTWDVKGDPTEGAMVVLAEKAGVSHEGLNNTMPRVEEIPFSSETKRMTTMHKTAEGVLVCSKGAPEVIVDSCAFLLTDKGEIPMTEAEKAKIFEAGKQMAGEALRVLGAAYKKIPAVPSCKEDSEKSMVFAGLAGMIDPPRAEAKEAIKLCQQAGIKVVMITGDHKITAMAVAKELGILRDGGRAITGAELDALDDKQFETVVEDINVYARVSPAHKLRVIEAFDNKGEIVAMTGDGVNDAPALKKADIGIAMGITGTDVSKEAAAMVLTDDNFASIVSAVEEGRGIYLNIKKFLIYMVSCNVGEVLIMFIAGLVGMAIPLAAIHLLFINLSTDGFPALALSVDPADPDIMNRPPRNPKSSIFSKDVLATIFSIGIVMAITMIAIFVWKMTSEGGSWSDSANPLLVEAQTMVLGTMVLFELFTALACRSQYHSFFALGPMSNKWLIYANLSSFALLAIVMYVPFFNGPFDVIPLGWEDWRVMAPVSLTGFATVEIVKIFNHRYIDKQMALAKKK